MEIHRNGELFDRVHTRLVALVVRFGLQQLDGLNRDASLGGQVFLGPTTTSSFGLEHLSIERIRAVQRIELHSKQTIKKFVPLASGYRVTNCTNHSLDWA